MIGRTVTDNPLVADVVLWNVKNTIQKIRGQDDRIAEHHGHHRDESGERLGDIRHVNLLGRIDHQHPNHYERSAGGRTGDEEEKRREKYRDDKQESDKKSRKSRTSALGDAQRALNIYGDGGAAHESSASGSNDIAHHGLAHTGYGTVRASHADLSRKAVKGTEPD